MTEAPDTTSMTGAAFQREVGTDPAKWAEAMDKEAGALWKETDGVWPRNHEERIAFLTKWFRDAMDAAAKNGTWKISARVGYGTKRSD